MHNGRVRVPGFPCTAGMHYRNKENTLTFPVAPHTVHLGGIGSGLHRAGFGGSPLLSSGARSWHSGSAPRLQRQGSPWPRGCRLTEAAPAGARRGAGASRAPQSPRQRISAARPRGCLRAQGCGRRSIESAGSASVLETAEAALTREAQKQARCGRRGRRGGEKGQGRGSECGTRAVPGSS